MTTITSTPRFQSYTLDKLASSAMVRSDGFINPIPSIPDNLLIPIMTEQYIKAIHKTEDDTKSTDTGAQTHIQDDSKSTASNDNSRFYIDETHMTERRFLNEATKTFESERDVDLFADATLLSTMTDCIISQEFITNVIQKTQARLFLEGKTEGNGNDSMLVIADALKNHTEYEAGRIRSRKEMDITEQNAYNKIYHPETSDFDKVSAIAYMTGYPVIIESETGMITFTGPSPVTPEDDVCWIRGVVDGYLGIMMKAKDAEQRYMSSSTLHKSPDARLSAQFLNKKLRVAHLKEAYITLFKDNDTETPIPKLKKAELIKEVSSKCIWGITLSSIIVV